jgi:YVTN family beta-propeller protein
MKSSRIARASRAAIVGISVTSLVACGSGAGPEPASPAASISGADDAAVKRANATATILPGSIPADAHLRGMWSAVNPWPLISVHAVLLNDGRVLSYGTDGTGRQTGFFTYDVWDPALGLGTASHTTLPNGTGTDIFCGSQVLLPSGSVMLAGGDNWTGTGTTNTGNNNSNVFSPADNSLVRGNNMQRARWYSTSTTLLNGETYIQGGTGGTDRPEVRGADGVFRLLTGANTSGFDFMYPRNFIAPDGRVFGFDSAGRMYFVDPSGLGTVTAAGQFTQTRGNDSSAAMFAPGRILQFGGSSNAAVIIDITSGTPIVSATQSMSTVRKLVNAAILPDGKVLATGGSTVWNQLTGVNNVAEIWNPSTGTWTQGAAGARARLYHSVSLLLPDASVLVSGGGAPGPQNNTNAEIYFPPYLFTSTGALADRPVIDSAPATLDIGRTFRIDISGPQVSRVTLVKAGSVTHSWNMEQRFIDLAFSSNNGAIAVQAPSRAADAPPGYYMLFVLDANGVPSIAKMVKVNIASVLNPDLTPTITSPGNQSHNTGVAVDVQVAATDPNGDSLTYTATGLPTGLSIDAATGRITGAPTAIGSYNVVVGVSDGVNSANASLTWSVTAGAPLVLTTPDVAPVAVGSAVAFSASANNAGTVFKWNFGDGSPDTPWLPTGQVEHTYSEPGAYYVTVTAVDGAGMEVRRTFLQVAHLPLTPTRPAASSSIAYEARSGVNPRLWVVNQDNNSVSVFDAITRNRLAEIAVGSAPRSIGIAANGMVWVTNKQGWSISVIDPATLAVNRTLSLPRASQPHGLVMSPAGDFAYVAMEATGQVRRYSTASYAVLATTAVGPNPRHVAVSADGTSVYVSRFITPLLPGESTATVAPTAGTGGEIVQLAASTMTPVRTIVLAHSDRPDFENQGRGIPNYLGAMAISPDGTQAYVPSKQDNVLRGALRDGSGLNFQSTVRAISSRVALPAHTEDPEQRIDHDNASVASAAVYDRRGVYLFVSLETSREIVVLDAHRRGELFRVDAGRAPQGLALSADGLTLYVENFMDRTLGVFDLRPLIERGEPNLPAVATLGSVGTERLAAQVLLGKQLFYDARDPRLARDRYMSCATCHNDGGQDGRVWDLTGFGEGLRNTVSLRGRANAQGFLHWTGNFDEVQDFEGQIRQFAGGTGLMSDAAYLAGTRAQPLGDRKTGLAPDLDALAAYVGSLNAFDNSPLRSASNTLTPEATAGRTVFQNLNCAACHAGTLFTGSGDGTLSEVGTIKSTSGTRLGLPLVGFDAPTLRDVWATAPYLHDGSAPTLADAVRAHRDVTVSDADLVNLTAYLGQIGREEASAPQNPGAGIGLTGRYFNNMTLGGTAVVTRVEAIDFNWGSAAPSTGVNANQFSARWTGFIEAPATGTYVFQTNADDGVRLWVNGQQLVNRWTNSSARNDNSVPVNLVAGQRYPVTMEYFENGGQAVARLRWRAPGTSTFVAVPAHRLIAN